MQDGIAHTFKHGTRHVGFGCFGRDANKATLYLAIKHREAFTHQIGERHYATRAKMAVFEEGIHMFVIDVVSGGGEKPRDPLMHVASVEKGHNADDLILLHRSQMKHTRATLNPFGCAHGNPSRSAQIDVVFTAFGNATRKRGRPCIANPCKYRRARFIPCA